MVAGTIGTGIRQATNCPGGRNQWYLRQATNCSGGRNQWYLRQATKCPKGRNQWYRRGWQPIVLVAETNGI